MASTGQFTRVESTAVLLDDAAGEISIGDRCHIKHGVVIATYGGRVVIANRVSIGEYSVLYGHGGITIQDAAVIGPHCIIAAQQHIVGGIMPIRFTGETATGVALDEGCWIGARVTILDGVRIGAGAVIGAGSVVTRNIPPGVVALGIPCKPTRKIARNRLYGSE
jgi:acetyltransferase-like isoleucine patch superfamily enzyme